MKTLLILCILFSVFNIYAATGTCTSVTRTDYVTNQVLTSTALNGDFNGILTNGGATHGLNNFDGGCTVTGSLEPGAMNTSWGPVQSGIREGCRLSIAGHAELTIGKCMISVDSNLIKTTSDTAFTDPFACSGCASESTDQIYYVYATSASSLTPKTSTTVPGNDGFNGTDRVIGSFYNDATGNIATYTVDEWIVSDIDPIGEIAILKDVRSNGTNGGSATNGSWETRSLTAIEGNESFVSLSSNQFTLSPGSYVILWRAGAVNAGMHTTRLYNITTSAKTSQGTVVLSNDGTYEAMSFGKHIFNISVSTVFEIQSWVGSSHATTGYGVAGAGNIDGSDEIYSQVLIRRIK